MNNVLAFRIAKRLLPSRCAKETTASDLMLRFENAERAIRQSAATNTGRSAEPPPRERLSPPDLTPAA